MPRKPEVLVRYAVKVGYREPPKEPGEGEARVRRDRMEGVDDLPLAIEAKDADDAAREGLAVYAAAFGPKFDRDWFRIVAIRPTNANM